MIIADVPIFCISDIVQKRNVGKNYDITSEATIDTFRMRHMNVPLLFVSLSDRWQCRSQPYLIGILTKSVFY